MGIPYISTWRYAAQLWSVFRRSPTFRQNTPTPTSGRGTFPLTAVDYLRYLLADEGPELKAAGLTGGLDIWLFRNTERSLLSENVIQDHTSSGTVPGKVSFILVFASAMSLRTRGCFNTSLNPHNQLPKVPILPHHPMRLCNLLHRIRLLYNRPHLPTRQQRQHMRRKTPRHS